MDMDHSTRDAMERFEWEILFIAMNDPDALPVVLGTFQPPQLSGADTRQVLSAMMTLQTAGVAVDVVTVADELVRTSAMQELGGRARFVDQLQNCIGSSKSLQSYIRRWREKANRWQVQRVGYRLMEASDTADSVDIAIAEAETALDSIKITDTASGIKTTTETLQEAVKAIDERVRFGKPTGVSTGIPELDAKISYLRPGNLVILAGRPGMGKTAAALNIAEHVARVQGQHTLVVSLEMEADELGHRMLASVGSCNLSNLMMGRLTDDDVKGMNFALATMRRDLVTVDVQSRTVLAISAQARRLQRSAKGLALVVVDYLQLMDSDTPSRDGNRNQDLSGISKGLKRLAKELRVPVIALSQLSREVEKRTDKRPQMSDLRDSGAIEQDADAVIFYYRDEYYSPDKNPGVAEAIVRKARMGSAGTVYLEFQGRFSRFLPLTPERQKQMREHFSLADRIEADRPHNPFDD